MKIELLQGWMGNVVGAIIDPGEGVADILINRGIAKKVQPVVRDKMLRAKKRQIVNRESVEVK